MINNETYELEIFYDPKKLGFLFFEKLYNNCGLKVPSEEKLRTPFYQDKERGLELVSTKISPLSLINALGISENILKFKDVGITIYPSRFQKAFCKKEAIKRALEEREISSLLKSFPF